MRYINIMLAALFLYFAALQLNDPDALLWIGVYLLAAITCVFAVFRRMRGLLAASVGIVAIGWATVLSLDITDALLRLDGVTSAAILVAESEEAREVLGLVCVFAWMSVLAMTSMWPRWRQPK